MKYADKAKAMAQEIMARRKHSPFCEGHVQCPNTGKEECGHVVVSKIIMTDHGAIEVPAMVYCFGCGETHNVKEE